MGSGTVTTWRIYGEIRARFPSPKAYRSCRFSRNYIPLQDSRVGLRSVVDFVCVGWSYLLIGQTAIDISIYLFIYLFIYLADLTGMRCCPGSVYSTDRTQKTWPIHMVKDSAASTRKHELDRTDRTDDTHHTYRIDHIDHTYRTYHTYHTDHTGHANNQIIHIVQIRNLPRKI